MPLLFSVAVFAEGVLPSWGGDQRHYQGVMWTNRPVPDASAPDEIVR